MHIDQPDSFRLWLESVLGPLCDADPIALARYVYALVRKEKPVDELRDSMIAQLDVFLQKETRSFVALMFKTIDNKEYLTYKKEAPLKDEKKDVVQKEEKKDGIAKEDKKDAKEEPTSSVEHVLLKQDAQTDEGITSSEEKPPTQIQSSVVSESTEKEIIDRKDDMLKKEVEREERFRLNRSKLKATGPGWNTRSRSRSWERGRRSRSRDRLDPPPPRDRDLPPREREKLDPPTRERDVPGRDRERDRERDRARDRPRLYRNKSPPRRYERRRSYNSLSPSPVRYRGGSRSKSRSPRRRFRNRSPSRSRSRSRSRDSSRSFDRRGSPPKGDNGLKDMAEEERRNLLGMLSAGNGRRCRDFDVRGYCLRGELCPYDHGKDPVVVNEMSLAPALTYAVNPPPGPGMMPGGPPLPGPMPPHMPPGGPPMHMFQNPPPMLMRPPPTMEYNPDAPSLNPNMNWCRPPYHPRGGPRMMHGMPFPPPNARDLINVPTDPHGGYRGENAQRGNCSLDIRKIPRFLNNITHLNNHFTKFGNIKNIQLNPNNDPEAATITYSSPAEAIAAYKSTEAVLNNRFIKVFWHGSSKDNNSRGNNNVRERLGTPQNTNPPTTTTTTTPVNTEPNVIVPTVNKSSKSNVWGARQKPENELILKNQIIRKKAEDTRKEALELSTKLRKKSQILMEKQIEQQKELLKKLECGTLDEKQRAAIKDAIKNLQKNIEDLKNEIVQGAKEVAKPVPKTKEQIQTEILNAEMDIIKAEQEGGEIVPLQKTLGQLKIELIKLQQASVPPLVIPPKANFSPYYSSHLTRGQPNNFATKPVVDYRPTKVLVSGYENDDKEMVLTHFKTFGEVVDYISDDSTPSMVLNYKTRIEAQIAMNKGKSFQDRLLSITWFSDPQLPPQRRNSSTGSSSYHMHAGRQVLLTGSKLKKEPKLDAESADEENEDPELETNHDFLLQDDEDEGDDEERSWRR